MEVEFLNLGLDIIGLGVFNYDFGSVTRESPVIKVRGARPSDCIRLCSESSLPVMQWVGISQDLCPMLAARRRPDLG